jgi:hypothetical protein
VRIVSETHRKTVIGKNGDVAQAILIDGVVAGTWSVIAKPTETTVAVKPFGRLTKADRVALTEEGERLAAFIVPASKAQRVVFG